MMNTPKKISALLFLLLLRDTGVTAEPSQQSDVGHSLVRTAAAQKAQDVCQPHHIHLSVGRIQNSTHSSMTVSFSISSACVGKKGPGKKSIGAVRLIGEGEDDDFLVISDGNNTKSYDAMSPRRGIKRYYSDLYYHFEIDDLRPDKEYSYECLLFKKDDMSSQQYLREDKTTLEISGDNTSVIARSDISAFITPPAPGQWHSSGRTITFAVLGDLAAKEHSKKTIRHLDRHSESVDAILFAGDLAYPSKDHDNWDKWMDLMSKRDFFNAIPTQIALGNHDLDTYKHGWIYDINESVEIALAYEHRFQMPQIRPPIRELASLKGFTTSGQPTDFVPYEYGNAYYSFTFGPSKHIVLSSYSSFREGSLSTSGCSRN
mmetsp:Transcript_7984/g.16347  ORF Transcript_7984/g.16347 Transcript_7984/m.16347 type:complete len:374 (+) Transcript_7984:114-1235(+)